MLWLNVSAASNEFSKIDTFLNFIKNYGKKTYFKGSWNCDKIFLGVGKLPGLLITLKSAVLENGANGSRLQHFSEEWK